MWLSCMIIRQLNKYPSNSSVWWGTDSVKHTGIMILGEIAVQSPQAILESE